MKRDDFVMLIATLGAYLIVSFKSIKDIGQWCVRGICFGAKDRYAVNLLRTTLSMEQYDAMVENIRASLEADDFSAKDEFCFPPYEGPEDGIHCCFPLKYLLRALTEVIVIEG